MLAMMMGGVFYITHSAIEWIEKREVIKKKVLNQIDNLKEELQDESNLLEGRTKLRWHGYDIVTFCKEAERINPGWKCPDLDPILKKDDQ